MHFAQQKNGLRAVFFMPATSIAIQILCRSELAREEPESAAFIKAILVSVDDHRRTRPEQARSYSRSSASPLRLNQPIR